MSTIPDTDVGVLGDFFLGKQLGLNIPQKGGPVWE